MTKLPPSALQNMCASVEEVLRLACEEHPYKSLTGVLLGAVAGGLSLHSLNLGLGSVTVGGVCLHAGGVIVGSLIGAGFVLLLIAVYESYRRYRRYNRDPVPDLDALHVQHRTEQKQSLDSLMDDIAKQESLPAHQIQEFIDFFEDVFMKPLQEEPAPDTECSMCFADFSNAEESADLKPVRAPSCRRFHWIHKKCHVHWVMNNRRDDKFACVYCN